MLSQYHELLVEREKLLKDSEALKKQNIHMKERLDSLLQEHEINKDMSVEVSYVSWEIAGLKTT